MPDIEPVDQTLATIKDSMWEWLTVVVPELLSDQPEDYASLNWIIDFQDGYTPVRPFGTINVSESSKMITQQDTVSIYDSSLGLFKETTTIPTLIKVDLMIFGDNANSLLTKILMTVGNQETKDFFYNKGIRYNYKTVTKNRTTLVNRSYENRSFLQMQLFTLFANVHLIDPIEQVTVSGSVDGTEIDPITAKSN